MKKILAVVCVSAMIGGVAFAESGSLIEAFKNGAFAGQVGIVYTDFDYADVGGTDDGMLFGYVELGFKTDDYCGLGLGTTLVAVGELITDDDGFYEGAFGQNAALKEAYLTYAIPNTESSLLVGRAVMAQSPVMDGDVYEGVQLSVGDIPCTELVLQVITGWALNLSTDIDGDGINALGIDGFNDDDLFQGVDERIPWDAGEYVLSAMADITVVDDMLSVMPFITQQTDVVMSYGISADFEMAATEELLVVADATVAMYDEDTGIVGVDDALAWTIRGGVETMGVTGGVGYYSVSDDNLPGLNGDRAVGAATFGPTIIIHDQAGIRDESTWFVDLGWSNDMIALGALYANGESDRANAEAEEIDLTAEVELMEDVKVKGYFARANGEGDTVTEFGLGASLDF